MRKPPRGIRGLRHIKTACGPSYPRAVSTGRRSIIPPDESSYSMRSFTPGSFGSGGSGGGGGMGGGMARAQGPNKSPFKPRVAAPSRPSLLCVQRFCEPVFELSRERDCINICIPFPPAAAKVAQLDVYGDILIVQAEAVNVQYYVECLLPFKAVVIDHSYNGEVLCINLKRKDQ